MSQDAYGVIVQKKSIGMEKEYNLQRFVEAQEHDYQQALSEIRSGGKRSHWIWYVFPQQKGLGRSYNSEYYGLDGEDEARAYLQHPVLGARLREMCSALLSHRGTRTVEQLMGNRIDTLKLRSSMTLFDRVSANDIFAEVLGAFFNKRQDSVQSIATESKAHAMLQQLRQRDDLGPSDFVFFWGHHAKTQEQTTKACLSQWFPCHFEVDGQTYNCAEQFMMAEKARVFGDEAVRQMILNESEPQTIKQLGREVKAYDDAILRSVRYEVVVKGNLHKFAQNAALRQYLLSTSDRILAEASPFDNIWGIGIDEHHAEAIQPAKWKGLNLLGFALMEVRTTLKTE